MISFRKRPKAYVSSIFICIYKINVGNNILPLDLQKFINIRKMDVLFDPRRYEFLYNCSAYPVDTKSIEERRNVAFGIIILTMSALFMASITYYFTF